jgi:hypothetical protein
MDDKALIANRRSTRQFSNVSLGSARRDSMLHPTSSTPYSSNTVTSNSRKHLAASWLLNMMIGGVLACLYFVNETFFQLKHRLSVDEEDDWEDYFVHWSLWWLYYSLKGVGAVRMLCFSTSVLVCIVLSLKLRYRWMQWIGVAGLCTSLTVFSFYLKEQWAVYALLGAGVGASLGCMFTAMLSSLAMVAYVDFYLVAYALIGLPFGGLWFYFLTVALSDAVGFAWLLRSAAVFMVLVHFIIVALLLDDHSHEDHVISLLASSEKNVLDYPANNPYFGKSPLFTSFPARNRAWAFAKAVRMGILDAKAVAALHDGKLHALLFSHVFIGIGVFQPLIYISDQVFRFELQAFLTILLIATTLLSVVVGCLMCASFVEEHGALHMHFVLTALSGVSLLLWATCSLFQFSRVALLVSLCLVCLMNGMLLGMWVTTMCLVVFDLYESEASVVALGLLTSVTLTSAVLGAQMARIVRRAGHGYSAVAIFSASTVLVGSLGVIMICNYVTKRLALP